MLFLFPKGVQTSLLRNAGRTLLPTRQVLLRGNKNRLYWRHPEASISHRKAAQTRLRRLPFHLHNQEISLTPFSQAEISVLSTLV